ncbi:hypothetical protein [Rhodococcoides yunnanense]|uniref:hypothetical protein n=1 Tax=Rhodococcoides yunnanense TaxID=278209 RepID=UPI0022B101F7|nr:hypothetical protein [Rhodococcus yunnanensis]MCZ4277777.1 hypothetical protein [Rhodococcus yunnanensis]
MSISVGALVVSTAVAVMIGKAIAHADRIESARWSGICCTGCGLPIIDRRPADHALVAQPERIHDPDDENYCTDCTATRFHTWGYSP